VLRALLYGLLLLLTPASALADPVDLRDRTPRWISVAFEVSPADKPAQMDTVYTPAIPAWLEPAADAGQIRVTVDRHDVEATLLADDGAVAGSFSDFVWVFDAASGEVVSAQLTGTMTKELDWGLFRSQVETRIEVDMATARVGGFKKPRSWLGQTLFHYCDDLDGPCRIVGAAGYDASTGYVNAIGTVSVEFGELTIRTFSPLGEAVLSEVDPATLTASRTAPPASSGSAAIASGHGEIADAGWHTPPAVSAGPPPRP